MLKSYDDIFWKSYCFREGSTLKASLVHPFLFWFTGLQLQHPKKNQTYLYVICYAAPLSETDTALMEH